MSLSLLSSSWASTRSLAELWPDCPDDNYLLGPGDGGNKKCDSTCSCSCAADQTDWLDGADYGGGVVLGDGGGEVNVCAVEMVIE